MDKTSIEPYKLSTEIAMIMIISILLEDYTCIDNY